MEIGTHLMVPSQALSRLQDAGIYLPQFKTKHLTSVDIVQDIHTRTNFQLRKPAVKPTFNRLLVVYYLISLR